MWSLAFWNLKVSWYCIKRSLIEVCCVNERWATIQQVLLLAISVYLKGGEIQAGIRHWYFKRMCVKINSSLIDWRFHNQMKCIFPVSVNVCFQVSFFFSRASLRLKPTMVLWQSPFKTLGLGTFWGLTHGGGSGENPIIFLFILLDIDHFPPCNGPLVTHILRTTKS